MTTLTETLAGLTARLETIPDLRVHDHIPEDLFPPAAVIMPPTVGDYREDLGAGSMRVTFPVLLLVQATIARQQLELYELIDRTGPRSLFATITGDPTLGGLNVTANPTNVEDFDTTRVGLIQYYGRLVNIDTFIS